MKKLQGIVSEMKTVAPVTNQVKVPVLHINRSMETVCGVSNAIYVPNTTVKGEVIKKIKVVNWKRFGLGIVITSFLLSIAVFGMIHTIGGKDSLDDNIEYITVSVDSGDTVWNLVKENNPHYDGDIRNLVDLVRQANGGKTNIVAGDSIRVPVIK
jgi:hypothetical protein